MSCVCVENSCTVQLYRIQDEGSVIRDWQLVLLLRIERNEQKWLHDNKSIEP